MIHKDDCKCVNCVAKGSPVREIFIKTVTAEELVNVEIFDWLEGYGQISSLAEQEYIRRYGFLLVKLQLKNKQLGNELINARLSNSEGWKELQDEVKKLQKQLLLSESQNYCKTCGNILDGYVPPGSSDEC